MCCELALLSGYQHVYVRKMCYCMKSLKVVDILSILVRSLQFFYKSVQFIIVLKHDV